MVRVYLCMLVALLSISHSKATCVNSNYELVGGRCLRLQPKKTKSFASAQQACLADGAQLVMPNSLAEQKSLLSWNQIPNKKKITELWIGLQTTLTWADNSTLSSIDSKWIKWGKGKKSKPGCVVITPGNKGPVWIVSPCTSRRAAYVVCQMDAGCPVGFSQRGQSCYMYVNEETSQSDALADCTSRGGFLAEAQDQTANDAIISILQSNNVGDVNVWLGATKVNDVWVWTESGDAFTYTAWGEGQPDNIDGNQNCLVMNRLSGNGYTWDDWWCTDENTSYGSYGYICQANI